MVDLERLRDESMLCSRANIANQIGLEVEKTSFGSTKPSFMLCLESGAPTTRARSAPEEISAMAAVETNTTTTPVRLTCALGLLRGDMIAYIYTLIPYDI